MKQLLSAAQKTTMHTMKPLAYPVVFLVALIGLGFAGCSKAPVRLDVKADAKTPKDPWVAFVDTVRYTETTSAGDEWTRFRGGFELLNSTFTKADVVKSIREPRSKIASSSKAKFI